MPIKYAHPWWRRLIFPIFDLYDLVVTASLMTIAALFLLILGKEDILIFAMLAGYAGIVIFLNDSSPAILRGMASDKEKAISLLATSEYTENDGRWEPTFRQYTRSPNDYVRLSVVGGILEISGPFDVLKAIQDRLEGAV